jgi:hypothetical protein
MSRLLLGVLFWSGGPSAHQTRNSPPTRLVIFILSIGGLLADYQYIYALVLRSGGGVAERSEELAGALPLPRSELRAKHAAIEYF